MVSGLRVECALRLTVVTDQAEVINNLLRFVLTVDASPVFRRCLRYEPRQTLTDFGFALHFSPKSLPVRHCAISVQLDEQHLFGVAGGLSSRSARLPTLAVRLVLLGVKPMALVHGPEFELVGLARWARRCSLATLLSPSEFVPQVDTGKGGFANLAAARRPAQAGSGAWRGLLVATDWNQVMLGWLSLLYGWDELLGFLLGYPPCCVDAYRQHWPAAATNHEGDVAPLMLGVHSNQAFVGRFDWRANILGRYFGFELIQHFPCRLDCPATISLAQRFERALCQWFPEELALLEKHLTGLVVFTEYDGVYHFPDGVLHTWGDEMSLQYQPYTVAMSDNGTMLAKSIYANREIRITQSGIEVAGNCVAAWIVLFEKIGQISDFQSC